MQGETNAMRFRFVVLLSQVQRGREMSWACEAWRIAHDWLLVAICTAVSIVFGYVRVGTVQWTWPKSDVLRNGVGHGTFSSTLLL